MSDEKIECEKCGMEAVKGGNWVIYPKLLKDCYPVVHCDNENRVLGVAYMTEEELAKEFPSAKEGESWLGLKEK